MASRCENYGPNPRTAFETVVLERGRGMNSWCSGEMRRDQEEEHRWRRQHWAFTDALAQRGEQPGLDTLVVHAVNDDY